MNEILYFQTEFGRYLMTRRERHRLAILHEFPEPEARQIAFGAAGIGAAAFEDRAVGDTFDADVIFARFHANGKAKGKPLPMSAVIPAGSPA